MRSGALLSLALLSTGTLPAVAADRFSCGDAEVRIEVLARDTLVLEERAESVVTVSRKGRETVLRYRNIDFIGGACVDTGKPGPLVAFQAYCGGSGCQDGANWGVIDATSLRVLTVPSDTNRAQAQQLLGGALPVIKTISVVNEARKQGVEIF